MTALLRLFRFLKGSVGALAVSLALLLTSTALGLVQPRLIEYAIDRGIKAGSAPAIVWGASGILLSAVFCRLAESGLGLCAHQVLPADGL
jgi:ABC-type multidrug transport system fused ATPase/permease subunit